VVGSSSTGPASQPIGHKAVVMSEAAYATGSALVSPASQIGRKAGLGGVAAKPWGNPPRCSRLCRVMAVQLTPEGANSAGTTHGVFCAV